jgi:hypothetical protein
VTTGLARVKARAALQVEELSLSETLESLKSERDHWKALATAQESEIETFRQLAILATENLEETQALGNRVRAHAQKKIKQLETELSRLRAEATKDKVIPIFSTSKSKGKRYEK